MSVSTDLDLLVDTFRLKVERLEAILAREGLPMRLFEARRSFTRSSTLFMQGRTYVDGVIKIVDEKKIVTGARAGSSPHNWGLAVDYVLVTGEHDWWDDEKPTGPWDTGYTGGKLLRPSVKLAWERYGRSVRQADLTWGGDFPRVDMPHAEAKGWRALRPANWQEIALREVKAGR